MNVESVFYIYLCTFVKVQNFDKVLNDLKLLKILNRFKISTFVKVQNFDKDLKGLKL